MGVLASGFGGGSSTPTLTGCALKAWRRLEAWSPPPERCLGSTFITALQMLTVYDTDSVGTDILAKRGPHRKWRPLWRPPRQRNCLQSHPSELLG